jgi:hypothetical protein
VEYALTGEQVNLEQLSAETVSKLILDTLIVRRKQHRFTMQQRSIITDPWRDSTFNEFAGKASCNRRASVVQEYLETSNSAEIDMEVADDLVATAALLSHRLTIEWANSIRKSQVNDGDLTRDAHRQRSATNLARPFKPSSDVRPNCG